MSIGWGAEVKVDTRATDTRQCAFVIVVRKINEWAHLADTGRHGTSQPWVFLATKINDVRKVLENFGWDFTNEATVRQV